MYPKNKIYAISGLKNSGKDTAAAMLQYLLNTPKFLHFYPCYKCISKIKNLGKYKVVSFANPLKRTLSALLNVPIEKFSDRDFKENYYIFFPTLDITNNPPYNAEIVSDNAFARFLKNKNFEFLKTSWISIRQLLQVFGTECMRETFGDKLWILTTLQEKRPIIISDLRFKVELSEIKSRRGITICIDRDICIPGNHASEKEFVEMKNNNMFDYIILNNGTLEDLFNSLKSVLKNGNYR